MNDIYCSMGIIAKGFISSSYLFHYKMREVFGRHYFPFSRYLDIERREAGKYAPWI